MKHLIIIGARGAGRETFLTATKSFGYGHEFDINKYDFIVANILATPLISLAEPIEKSLNRDGILVLSGFNAGDYSVLEKYASLGLELKYKYIHEDWLTLVLHKR